MPLSGAKVKPKTKTSTKVKTSRGTRRRTRTNTGKPITSSQTRDAAVLSKETSTLNDAKAKAKADQFATQFAAAFADEEAVAQQNQALADYVNENVEAPEGVSTNFGTEDVESIGGTAKTVTEKVADGAGKFRRSRKALRTSRRLGVKAELPKGISRGTRKFAKYAAGISAATGAAELAFGDGDMNSKLGTGLNVADDLATSAQLARTFGATSRYGLGFMARSAPILGAGAMAMEGVNQMTNAETTADTISGGLKTGAAMVTAAGATSVVGAVPAAIVGGGMYGAAMAIDHWDSIEAGAGYLRDAIGPEIPRSQDPRYKKTARGYRLIRS